MDPCTIVNVQDPTFSTKMTANETKGVTNHHIEAEKERELANAPNNNNQKSDDARKSIPSSCDENIFRFVASLHDNDRANEEEEKREESSSSDESNTPSSAVQIVDMSDIGKGNGLVATRDICKGEVIFTATANPFNADASGPILPCHYCFRCMEPASWYGLEKLPLIQCWPVPDYDESFQQLLGRNKVSDSDDDEDNTPQKHNHNDDDESQFKQDEHGRVICRLCKSLFCSVACKDAHNDMHMKAGNRVIDKQQQKGQTYCCLLKSVCHIVLFENYMKYNTTTSSQWALTLGTRIFCYILTQYRQTGTLDTSMIDGLCGDSEDLTPLELGVRLMDVVAVDGQNAAEEHEHGNDNNNNDNAPNRREYLTKTYTVEPFYNALCEHLSFNNKEKSLFSLEFFSRLIAITKRNTLGIQTKSPYTIYEDNVRASDDYDFDFAVIRKRVAMTLISLRGSCQNLDLDDITSVSCGTVLSLVSRMNHSCCPTADGLDIEVYETSSVNIVAQQDLVKGDEITISYLTAEATKTWNRQKRRTNLQNDKSSFVNLLVVKTKRRVTTTMMMTLMTQTIICSKEHINNNN